MLPVQAEELHAYVQGRVHLLLDGRQNATREESSKRTAAVEVATLNDLDHTGHFEGQLLFSYLNAKCLNSVSTAEMHA